jgi:hypothetical protein
MSIRSALFFILSLCLLPACQSNGLAFQQLTQATAVNSNSNYLFPLKTLTNPDTLKNSSELEFRLKKINAILEHNDDPMGVFTGLYLEVTKHAVKAIDIGIFEDNAQAEKLTTEFGRVYLRALYDQLNDPNIPSAWKEYYQMALHRRKPTIGQLISGINAHITLDFPETIAQLQLPESFKSDFLMYGEALFQGKNDIIDRLRVDYNLNTVLFFNGFFAGNLLPCQDNNAHNKADIFARLGFQSIRAEAWENAKLLQSENNTIKQKTRLGMKLAFKARQLIANCF